MPLPQSVSIGGRRIRIVIVPDLEEWGHYVHDDGVIRLASRCLSKASTLRETLRHEMLHAALNISGVAFLERFDEECVVRCVESIFMPAWDSMRKKLETLKA